MELTAAMLTRVQGFLLGLEFIQQIGKFRGGEVGSNVQGTRGSAVQVDFSHLLSQLVQVNVFRRH